MVCMAIAFLLSDVFQTERSARCTNLVQVRCHGFLIEWIKEGFHRFQPIWPHSIEFQCSTCGHRGFVPNLSLIQDITGMNNMMENRWEKITGYGEHKSGESGKKIFRQKSSYFPLSPHCQFLSAICVVHLFRWQIDQERTSYKFALKGTFDIPAFSPLPAPSSVWGPPFPVNKIYMSSAMLTHPFLAAAPQHRASSSICPFFFFCESLKKSPKQLYKWLGIGLYEELRLGISNSRS